MTEPSYDFLQEGFTDDIDFYRELAKTTGGPVLELASGIGRIAFPIAEAGLEIVSMESASWMLEDAVREREGRNRLPELIQGDYRHFSFKRRFPLIIFPFNSFSLLHTRPDFEACLAGIHRHLLPEGIFAFDIFNPSLEALNRNPFERRVIARFPSSVRQARVTVTETIDYNRATQINSGMWCFSFGRKGLDETTSHRNRMFFPQEIDMILHYNGFNIRNKYGDFRRSPFVGESSRQVFICAARPGWKGIDGQESRER